MTSLKFRRKHSLEIIYEILEYVYPAKPISRIMTKLGMSWTNLAKYLEILVDVGLITDERTRYKRLIERTEKGVKLLNCFHEIQVLLNFNPLLVQQRR